MCACPYLGLNDDATIMLSEATPAHRCYAIRPPSSPEEEYQVAYCLSEGHVQCQYFAIAAPLGEQRAPVKAVDAPPKPRRSRRGAFLLASALTLAALVTVAVFVVNESFGILPRPTPTQAQVVVLPTSTATVTPTPTEAAAGTATPTLAMTEVTLPTPTPAPINTAAVVSAEQPASLRIAAIATPVTVAEEINLTPKLGNVGWWDSAATIQLGLNDSFLYAGVYGDQRYVSAARFDLTKIPRGAPILGAELRLTGLVDSRLSADADGTWLVQLISEKELSDLAGVDFLMLFSAPSSITLRGLSTADLAYGKVNRWELNADVRSWLEQQLLDGAKSVIVRITASTNDTGDTLFAWDSGVGPKTEGNPPTLALQLGPPPATPPPFPTFEYLVATFTPVPENVLTVVAMQSTATAVAETTGTYTPVPPFITPTPQAQNLATVQARANLLGQTPVVLETPVPQNGATATANAEYATAVAMTTGTFTPVPTNYVTPFVVPPSPPPGNTLTAVARLAEATQQALSGAGTPTPLPFNAVIGEFVIATVTPVNVATAAAISAEATANAKLFGPATPTPWNWLVITPTPLPLPTATPTTPVLILSSQFTPTPIPPATEVVPVSLPDQFRNVIIFKSTRSGSEKTWMYNPATGDTGLITRDWVYPMARAQLTRSPDGKREVFVKRDSEERAQLFIRNYEYGTEKQLTTFSSSSYDPAWSPTGEWIAFVSTNTGNDEIYRISPDGSIVEQLTKNQWEWDKHPTWSPDGEQIVFFSNRQDGKRLLWIMNKDGSNQRLLLPSEAEDFYPVWTR